MSRLRRFLSNLSFPGAMSSKVKLEIGSKPIVTLGLRSGRVEIPRSLSEKVERVHGELGRAWLEKLPALVNECRERWSLQLGQPFANLSYNLALPATASNGAELVLKLGVPCPELFTEGAALGLFQGVGAVRLLDHEAPRGILLMERVVPGSPIHNLQSEPEATRTTATLMREMWRSPPANHEFPSLANWFQAFARLRKNFAGGCGPFPAKLIDNAERTFAELTASSDRQVILHGDLHHANILFSAERGWLAIDPKGICGDPGYEVGPFMLNQLPAGASESATMKILKQRLAIFAGELGVHQRRLAEWSFCHAVLSAVWDFEESAEWHQTIKLALMLEQLAKVS
jgi:streptomycin 6-kinase